MTSKAPLSRHSGNDHFTVAIIGHTGRGGYGHYLDRAFQGVERTRVVAVSDPDEAARERVRAIYGSPVGYSDYREMLARERPDITVVASREIGDHHQIVMDVARSRSHVYLEKPVAASLAEVDDMIHACEAHDLTLVVAHPWRGHSPIQQVAIPAIRSGRIGEPGWRVSTGWVDGTVGMNSSLTSHHIFSTSCGSFSGCHRGAKRISLRTVAPALRQTFDKATKAWDWSRERNLCLLSVGHIRCQLRVVQGRWARNPLPN